MTKKLKYSIFCNRKRFNVISWLKVSSEKTYAAFCAFLDSRNVLPPDEDYFNRALTHFNSTHSVPLETKTVETQPVVEEVVPVIEILDQKVDTEAVTQPAEEIQPETVAIEPEVQISHEPLKEVKKTTRRKRRRKTADVNNEN